jgi:hypothetical protein
MTARAILHRIFAFAVETWLAAENLNSITSVVSRGPGGRYR